MKTLSELTLELAVQRQAMWIESQLLTLRALARGGRARRILVGGTTEPGFISGQGVPPTDEFTDDEILARGQPVGVHSFKSPSSGATSDYYAVNTTSSPTAACGAFPNGRW